MKENKAKEFLERYRTADRKIRMLNDEIAKVEALANGSGIAIDGQPHGTATSDKVATAATAAADLKEKLSAWLFEQEKIKREIIDVLAEIKDGNQLLVLRLRYLSDDIAETWYNIAYCMQKSERQVQRIHGRALQEVEKIIERKGATT